jgi:DNA-binding CsgD family transcriptional regulator
MMRWIIMRNEAIMLTTAASNQGFILLDNRLRPIAYNSEAVQILSFPAKPDRIRQVSLFIHDKIRSNILGNSSPEMPEFAKEWKAGRRTYNCRAFQINCSCNSEMKSPIAFAIILERRVSHATALSDLSREFELTTRECETVSLLVEGLTSKEIASRMQISPNTVKAFLRLVMVKMDVSTRSGIVGKALGPAHSAQADTQQRR